MRIALCLSGYPRTLHHCIESISSLSTNMDIFCHFWEDQTDLSFFTSKSMIVEKQKDFTWLTENRGKQYSTDIPNNVASMYYSIFRANELKSEYEDKHGKYDIVIRCRTDIMFKNYKIENPNTITIPHMAVRGLNDQFAYGPSDLMNVYSLVYKTMENKRPFKFAPHMALADHLKNYQIDVNIKKIPYVICREKHIGMTYEEIIKDYQLSRIARVAKETIRMNHD